MSLNLTDLRIQIDAIDQQWLALLNSRAQVAEKVGEVKKREGTPFFRPDRVAKVIEQIQHVNPGPLKSEHIAAVWREIMSACLALESPVRVAYLGPAGTFSEQAVYQQFGRAVEGMPCASSDEVFRATEAGTADFGVVPIENSSEGVINRTLDLLLQTTLILSGEVSGKLGLNKPLQLKFHRCRRGAFFFNCHWCSCINCCRGVRCAGRATACPSN